MNPSDPPLLIFDGACSYCRRWIARWQKWTGERVAYATSQDAADAYPEVPLHRFHESVVLVEPNGRISFGAEAVARSLAVRAPGAVLLWIYEHFPGARRISESAYRGVAGRRGRWRMR